MADVEQIAATVVSGSVSFNNINTWANTNAFGRDRVALTEWGTTAIPKVEAGGVFEAGGAYYEVKNDATITGTPSASTWYYVKFTPSTLVFAFTTTAPTWDSAKYGYYDGTDKYFNFGVLYDGSSYTKYFDEPNDRIYPTAYPLLEAYYSTNAAISGTMINFDTVTYNYGACFTNATGIFVTPVDGLYHLEFNGAGTHSANDVNVEINKGAVAVSMVYSSPDQAGGARVSLSTSTMIELAKDDQITVTGSGFSIYQTPANAYFRIVRIR